jgi:membrane peptidoglycan carboxypeptidase
MLEVYFNIIEWGPNVYGIGEASQYYFQNNQLT